MIKELGLLAALLGSVISADSYAALGGTPEQDKVCFYHGFNFTGTEVCYNAGQNVSNVGSAHNNKFSSVRVYGNAWVRTYEHTGYGGKTGFTFMDGYEFTRDNDSIGSLKVSTRTTDNFGCIFEHEAYRGTQQCYEAVSGAQFSNLDATFIGRNKASSVQIAGNARIQAFEDKNFAKDEWNYYFSSGQLSSNPNDNIDSFKVLAYDPADKWNYFGRMHEQRRLSDRVPLSRSNILGTHNSYNATRYRNASSPLGPNQQLTISEQLALGVRFLELDLHNSGGLNACHASDCALGFTRVNPARLLAEIHNYLKGNKPNDFVIVYIENKMETQSNYNDLKTMIEKGLGDYVYRPSVSAGSCQNTPYNETINNMRASGKKVLFLGVGCSSEVTASGLNRWAFKTGHSSRNADDADEEMNYENSTILSNSFMRIFECWHPFCKQIVNGNEIEKTLQAGANVIGMDQITWNDDNNGGRFERQIWSWRDGEYKKSGWDYNVGAVTREGTTSLDALIVAASVYDDLPYACLMPSGEWQITTQAGNDTWGGTAACQAIGGNFDVPLTPRESRRLFEALPVGVKAFVNYGTAGGKRQAGAFNPLLDRASVPQL